MSDSSIWRLVGCRVCTKLERVEPTPRPICSTCGLVPFAPRLTGSTEVVAESDAMQATLRRVARFARSDAPVVVLGETGTGKEILARLLHANSPRASGPFVAVNVAALPADLLESELFGHGKGAFTGATRARRGLFEAAAKGTLFLDEVAELPLPLQAKLLRALQDGEIRRVGENEAFTSDARIVSATHRDLASRVRQGTFREDLFYRLKVLSVVVPPLRQRVADILPLAVRLLQLESAHTHARRFSEDAALALTRYGWPGNVRELHNVVRHGAALARGALIHVSDLPDEVEQEGDTHGDAHRPTEKAADHPAYADRPQARASSTMRAEDETRARRSLAEVEREHILRMLSACDGSQAQAAAVLGIGRNTLWRKLRAYAEREAERSPG